MKASARFVIGGMLAEPAPCLWPVDVLVAQEPLMELGLRQILFG